MKAKLRDLTEEQYDGWLEDNCEWKHCNRCIFKNVECMKRARGCWIYHKDLYSDEFLNQKVDAKGSFLTEEEKEYLETVIRPFKDKVLTIYRSKNYHNPKVNDYLHILVQVKKEPYPNYHTIEIPIFKVNKMYDNLVQNAEYTLADLGLFENEI